MEGDSSFSPSPDFTMPSWEYSQELTMSLHNTAICNLQFGVPKRGSVCVESSEVWRPHHQLTTGESTTLPPTQEIVVIRLRNESKRLMRAIHITAQSSADSALHIR